MTGIGEEREELVRIGDAVEQLVETMARLRGEGGCPWDREQTHASLRPYVLEEAYEVAEAIDRGDSRALREELGDLLLQVVFHAQIAAEEGRFDLGDVAIGLREKLIRRHPHVFGELIARDAATVVRNWERLKTEEQTTEEKKDDLPRAMPALMRAQKMLRRAAAFGIDDRLLPASSLGQAVEAVTGAVREGRPVGSQAARAMVGDLLLAAVDLARRLEVDAEEALDRAVKRFLTDLARNRPAGAVGEAGEAAAEAKTSPYSMPRTEN